MMMRVLHAKTLMHVSIKPSLEIRLLTEPITQINRVPNLEDIEMI